MRESPRFEAVSQGRMNYMSIHELFFLLILRRWQKAVSLNFSTSLSEVNELLGIVYWSGIVFYFIALLPNSRTHTEEKTMR